MTGIKNLYYWDTCLFCAWLKDEKRDIREMDGVRDIIEKIKKRQASLITSTLTLAEVLPSKCPVGTYELFEDLLKRTTIQVRAVDRKTAKLAGDIRDHYIKNPLNGKNLAVPDSIHLATAIISGVAEFHTFDAGKQGKKDTLGLLPISGNVAGHNLIICKPYTQQPSFDLHANHTRIEFNKNL